MTRMWREYHDNIVEDGARQKAFDDAYKFGCDSTEELTSRYADNLKKSTGIDLDTVERNSECSILLAAFGENPEDYGI